MTEKKASWVELPGGIFTSDGLWFHTSEEDLLSFAPDVIHRYGLESLLRKAADWNALPVTMSVLSLGLLLLVSAPWQAATAAVLILFFLSVVSPSSVLLGLIPIMKKLNHPIIQGLLFVLILSFLAANSQMVALTVGLVGFVFLRWQIVGRVLSPVIQALRLRLSPLDAPDLILRNILLRAALKHGDEIGELAAMQRRMLEIMNYRKKSAK